MLICATTSHVGVRQEYSQLRKRFGTLGTDWTVDLRSLSQNSQGRTVETFRLSLRDGTRVDVHFDVTAFFET